jgi:hypothetical protein
MRALPTMNPKKPIETLILTLRGQKVILDADLAEVYGVATKRFNEAFKRNRERFPDDFAFQITAQEWNGLRSQIVTSSWKDTQNEEVAPNWSQLRPHPPTRLRPCGRKTTRACQTLELQTVF